MHKLTIHDYKYLEGDTVYWPSWGAALGVVREFCEGAGYGDFGNPTELGKRMMKEYEDVQAG